MFAKIENSRDWLLDLNGYRNDNFWVRTDAFFMTISVQPDAVIITVAEAFIGLGLILAAAAHSSSYYLYIICQGPHPSGQPIGAKSKGGIAVQVAANETRQLTQHASCRI